MPDPTPPDVSAYKPGTVAVITWTNALGVTHRTRAIASRMITGKLRWWTASDTCPDEDWVTDVRPLVVLDPAEAPKGNRAYADIDAAPLADDAPYLRDSQAWADFSHNTPESFWDVAVWRDGSWVTGSLDVAERKRIALAVMAATRVFPSRVTPPTDGGTDE